MLITISVAVHNECETLLKRCFNSILNQKSSNYEVVIVDDGSNNETASLCDEYVNKGFRVIHQMNTGLPGARNTGIDNANGKYIMFVDGDDYLINDNLVESLVKYIENQESDIVLFGVTSSTKTEMSQSSIENVNSFLLSQNKRQLELKYFDGSLARLDDEVYVLSSWAKLYNMYFLKEHNIRFFPELMRAQDGPFNLYCFHYGASISLAPVMGYYFTRTNFSSNTRKYSEKSLEYMKRYINRIEEFVKLYHNDDTDFINGLGIEEYNAIISNCNRCYFHPLNKKSFIERKKDFILGCESINTKYKKSREFIVNHQISVFRRIVVSLIIKERFTLAALCCEIRKIIIGFKSIVVRNG